MKFPREDVYLIQAASLLAVIKDDPARLDTVLELQRLLIRRLVRSERRIVRLKRARQRLVRIKARERLSRDSARALKALVKNLEQRLEDIRQLLFLWRCFGDGIAGVYQSKYSLKHLFYDANYNVKEGAGFLSGKEGFRREYRALCTGIRMQVLVVLSDLTNIIRHGDVCGLAGVDPLPIEMKSSKNTNARVARQGEQLDVLADFYANDGAPNFRGTLNSKRIALKNTEVTYERELNECMTLAFKNGIATVSPERGLRYLVIRYDHLSSEPTSLTEALAQYAKPATLGTWLTPQPSWLPAYPFALSMTSINAVQFMQEVVGVIVFIDLAIVKAMFAERGIHAVMLMDGMHAMQICLDPADLMKGALRISEQLFLRIACEFQSVSWFADEYSLSFDKMAEAYVEVNQDSLGIFYEPLPDWESVRDCFEQT